MKAKREVIARVVHDSILALVNETEAYGYRPWSTAKQVDRDTTLAVVDWVLDNPDAGPEEVHVWWEERKMEAGVSTGPVRTEGSHPSMIEYEELPASEKAKDRLVVGVVRAMEVML